MRFIITILILFTLITPVSAQTWAPKEATRGYDGSQWHLLQTTIEGLLYVTTSPASAANAPNVFSMGFVPQGGVAGYYATGQYFVPLQCDATGRLVIDVSGASIEAFVTSGSVGELLQPTTGGTLEWTADGDIKMDTLEIDETLGVTGEVTFKAGLNMATGQKAVIETVKAVDTTGVVIEDKDGNAIATFGDNNDTEFAGKITARDTISMEGGTPSTDDTIKIFRMAATNYDNQEEPAGVFVTYNSDTENRLDIGGGSSSVNAATLIRLRTASDATTQTGTTQLQIDSTGGVFMYNLKSGATQVAAGAAANELWHDTDDDTIKLGQ